MLIASRAARQIPRAVATVAACMLAIAAAWAQDFGDHSSATLTGKAWKALGEADPEQALTYTKKCREMYLAEAVKQQKGLTGYVPAEKAHDMWALNDVGTCLFIEGQLHEKQGRPKEAVAAYQSLVNDLGYCQCWDTKGWFWRPAEAAAGRLKQLEFDAKLD